MPFLKQMFGKWVPKCVRKNNAQSLIKIAGHSEIALSWIHSHPSALDRLCDSFHMTKGGAFACGGVDCQTCVFGNRETAIKTLTTIGKNDYEYYGYSEEELE